MTAFRVQAKRTTNSGPPPDLEFGELAYSDADQQFYIGRADVEQPPATFDGNPTDYGPAIATLTTDLATLDTSQAAQDTAIAAIEVEQGTQNNAIATLQALPITHGFTYDQTAEPVNPAIGATWRERSAGGLIVGEWEWSGSLWLSSERYAPLYSGLSASATGNNVMSVYPAFPVLLTGYSVNLGTLLSPQDSSNYWRFRHGPVGLSDVLNTINQSTTVPTFLTKKLATPLVITAPDPGDNRPEKVGSAGNLRTFQAITHYRLIRS